MPAYHLDELSEACAASGQAYWEFLRKPSMSLGVYRLPAGAVDPQSPHAEDEVYVVLKGRARLLVGELDHEVVPGSLVFVARTVPHRFHSIQEDLEILVLFAPAESGPAA